MGRHPVLLVANVGNTNVSLGVVVGERVRRRRRFPAVRGGGWREAVLGGGWPQPDALVIGSVNPTVDKGLCADLEGVFGVRGLYFGRDIEIPMRIRCRYPSQVGVDRLANALCARSLAGGAAIVADIGTAITLDAVSRGGDFLGGAILPGLGLSARALHEWTAQLPLVKPGRSRSVIGKETSEAIRSGLYWGTCGAVNEIVERLRRRVGGADVPLFLTGGDAALVGRNLARPSRVERDLTLLGVAMGFEASWGRKGRGGGSRS